MKIPAVYILLCCVFLPAGDAAAATRYVTPTGAGGASGADWANAYSNGQQAVNDCTTAGSMVYLKYGIYSNASSVIISNLPGITLSGGWAGSGGAPGDPTNLESVLTKTGGVMRIFSGYNSTATLARVTVSGGSLSSADNGAGLYWINSDATITNCVVFQQLRFPVVGRRGARRRHLRQQCRRAIDRGLHPGL